MNDILGIPYILQQSYIENHTQEMELFVNPTSSQQTVDAINEIKHLLKRPVVAVERYAKTKHAAAYFDLDPSFLTKRKGKDFKPGKHFFKPPGQSIVRWDIEALAKWLRSEESNQENITPKLANLLERS